MRMQGVGVADLNCLYKGLFRRVGDSALQPLLRPACFVIAVAYNRRNITK